MRGPIENLGKNTNSGAPPNYFETHKDNWDIKRNLKMGNPSPLTKDIFQDFVWIKTITKIFRFNLILCEKQSHENVYFILC